MYRKYTKSGVHQGFKPSFQLILKYEVKFVQVFSRVSIIFKEIAPNSYEHLSLPWDQFESNNNK